MPKKLNPFAHYIFALAITIFGYTLYAKFAVPIVEGPPVSLRREAVAPVANEPRTEADKSYLVSLVPEGAWELDSCKMLLTPQGTIFFKQWERVDDEGTYDLFPFTLVMNDPSMAPHSPAGTVKKKSPTILRAIEGATLKFSKPLVLGSDQEKAEMNSARLDGDVTIFRPAVDHEDEDLQVLTRNVQIDRNRVFTLADVEFAYGDHRGSGRNLAIELAHDAESYSARTFSTIAGIHQMELASVRRLVIQPPGSNDLPVVGADGKQIMKLQPATPFSNQESPLELSCAGAFLFQFENRTAEFRENVVVRQLDRFGDNIKCDQLKIEFSKDTTASAAELGGPAVELLPANDKSSMKIKSFVAQGAGPGDPAIITSNSSQTRIIGQQIAYDTATGTVQAAGHEEVSIVSPQFSFAAKELNYKLVSDGTIGPLNATGPGTLTRHPPAPTNPADGTQATRSFSAHWKKELTVETYDGSRQLIKLEGDAIVNMGDDTSIWAEQLHLLLWQLPDPASLGLTELEKKSRQTKTDWQYLPSRLTTRGQVKIVGPKLVGTAREFVADWPRPILKTPTGTEVGLIDGHFINGHFVEDQRDQYNQYVVRKVTTQDPSASSETQPVVRTAQYSEFTNQASEFSIPQDSVSGLNTGTTNQNAPTMKFDGDIVHANLFGDLESPQIKDLSVDGHITLDQEKESPGNADSDSDLKITGETLRMVPQSEDFFRVLVGGSEAKPATFASNGLNLRGTNLHLDQQANKLWIEGAGQMGLRPPAADPDTTQAAQSTVNSNSAASEIKIDVSEIEQVDVAWTGGMIFDGLRIYFEREVILDAKRRPQDNQQTSTKALSQALTVELKNRIDFGQLSNEGTNLQQDAQIKRLRIVNNVAENDSAFRLASYEEAEAPERQKRMFGKPVLVQNETRDGQGQLIQIQKFLVPIASVDAETGVLIAKGPGTVVSYQKQDGTKRNKLSGFSQSHPNQKSAGKSGIACVHVNFDGELLTNSDRREMTIKGNVRTAYGDVKSFEQTIDPDDEKTLSGGVVTLRCDSLQTSQWTPRNQTEQTTEMVATGNAHIKSQLFESTADRLTYSDMTDMLTVEGSSRSNANLWFRQNPKAKLSHLTAEKIMYRLSDQWTNVQGVKNLNIKRSGG